MKPSVKICGLTGPKAAELAFESGADYGGVIRFGKSPRFVPDEQVAEVLAAIPGGKRVMVDVETGTDVLENEGDRGFDFFQIHHDLGTSLATVAAWSGIVGRERLWLAPRIPPKEAFPQELLEFADTFVIDAFSKDQYGGTGKTGDWERFAQWQVMYPHKRFILAGGLSPTNIREAIQATEARFVDVNSGVESSPGIKDPEKLKALFAQF